MELRGAMALVTGAARRVGKAIATGLAREGASIVVHYGRSEAEAHQAAAQFRALGVEAHPVQADLRAPEEIERMFREIEALERGLGVLVNSAASFEKRPFLEIGASEWDEVLALNLRAPFLCTQGAARLMLDGGGGVVVNIADLSGLTPWKQYAHHGTSKAGLIHLTRAAARELAPEIRVNCVAPGAILPPPGLSEDSAAWRERGERMPLARTGHPDEVAQAVVSLAKNEYITGAVLPVDGGEHLLSART